MRAPGDFLVNFCLSIESKVPQSGMVPMSEARRLSLGDGFNRYFQISPAFDDKRLDDVYFIRKEAQARAILADSEKADRREIDEFDQHSVHCLVRTLKEPVRPAGCARLVLTDPAKPKAPLPFEVMCNATIDRAVIDPAALPRHQIAEISRLSILSDFRRRDGESGRMSLIEDSDFGDEDHPRFPYIPVSLYIGIVLMAQRLGMKYLFTLTEPQLTAHFQRLGVELHPIGPAVDKRKLWQPAVILVAEVQPSLRLVMRPLWRAIEIHVAAAFERR